MYFRLKQLIKSTACQECSKEFEKTGFAGVRVVRIVGVDILKIQCKVLDLLKIVINLILTKCLTIRASMDSTDYGRETRSTVSLCSIVARLCKKKLMIFVLLAWFSHGA